MKKRVNKHSSSGHLNEKDAIAEKTLQLKGLLEREYTNSELSNVITKRRLNWLRENIKELKEKYKHLPPEEMAHRIIYIEHMNIDPKDSRVRRITPTKIRIDSHNFCPYLEACRDLKLNTEEICKCINHQSFEETVKMIHPNLVFYRNYNNLRPKNTDYCEEYIELIE